MAVNVALGTPAQPNVALPAICAANVALGRQLASNVTSTAIAGATTRGVGGHIPTLGGPPAVSGNSDTTCVPGSTFAADGGSSAPL